MEPKDQAVSGFNSCPTEIWHLVFKLLSPAELGVLCFVNKDLRTITEPFYYSKIHWTWEDGHHPPPINRLLRTIICRPELATYITNVRLEGRFFRGWQSQYKIPKIPVRGAELDECITFIRATGVPYADIWIQELRDGTVDAFVALLLAQLPNLSTLYLGHTFIQESKLIGMTLRSAICNPSVDHRLPDFQHLCNVSFLLRNGQDSARQDRHYGIIHNKNTADVLPLLYLPNVQHLSASIENPSTFSWPVAHLPVLSKLTSLHLTHIREMYLGEVLSVAQHLKTLHYHWYYDSGLDDEFTTPIIDLNGIAAAISCVRGSLTDLTITADCDLGGSDQFFPALKTEGSFAAMIDFNMVKRFEVPWAFLVGFAQDTTRRLQDVVPRNIEFLSIRDDVMHQNIDGNNAQAERLGWPLWEWEDYAILGLLESWLKDWKSCTPHLRGISLLLREMEYEPYEWCPSMRQQYTDLGTRVGIQIEIIGLLEEP